MNKKIIITTFFIILAAGYLSFFIAEKNYDKKISDFDNKIIDFGDGVGRKQLFISGDKKEQKITIKKSKTKYCSHKLSGFEDRINLNSVSGYLENGVLIEISGFVGAHAENRQYFTLDKKNCPKLIKFKENESFSNNIYSDGPRFYDKDYDLDGLNELLVEYRDYDKDPLKDVFRKIYKYNSATSVFELSSTEKYSY